MIAYNICNSASSFPCGQKIDLQLSLRFTYRSRFSIFQDAVRLRILRNYLTHTYKLDIVPLYQTQGEQPRSGPGSAIGTVTYKLRWIVLCLHSRQAARRLIDADVA